MLLAEFDYDFKPTPTLPFIDTLKPRYDMWLLKRYGLPALYWNLMVKGRRLTAPGTSRRPGSPPSVAG